MIIEVEQISLGVVEVETIGGTPLAFEINAGHPLLTETVLLEVGPAGPPGPKGDTGDVTAFSVGDLRDVTLTAPQDGDTLIYASNRFINRPKTELVDGGNF